jgi:hypothetical protein
VESLTGPNNYTLLSVFTSEILTLLFDNLYADAIEAVNSRPASTPVLISNLGGIKSEERLWNRSQSVNNAEILERNDVLSRQLANLTAE